MKKLILVFTAGLILLLSQLSPHRFAFINVVFASPADVYGNDINFCEVWQYNGSDWNLVYNFTSTGGSVRIHDSWQVKFVVGTKLNDTLASSSSEALDYTKTLMNITYGSPPSFVWQNVELNNTSISQSGGFYWIVENGVWTTDLPVEGVTYNCAIDYRQYY